MEWHQKGNALLVGC